MKKGFTLIETLVAVFILTLGIIATSTITQRNLQGAYYSRDQIAAYFLAEEAVEAIRNMRDTNILSGGGWTVDMNFPDVNQQPKDVCVETTGGIPRFLPDNQCDADMQLFYDENEGYGHSVGTASRYTRRITIARRDVDEVELKVVISWGNSVVSDKSFTIYKSLFNR